jgi:hypothetical protein
MKRPGGGHERGELAGLPPELRLAVSYGLEYCGTAVGVREEGLALPDVRPCHEDGCQILTIGEYCLTHTPPKAALNDALRDRVQAQAGGSKVAANPTPARPEPRHT